jgi:CRISPR/Cas system-associated protein Cas10 (large subunit of type III CRISPR-Cas system)
VLTTVIVSLCGLFDKSRDAVNLRAIVNRVLRREYLDRFREFHRQAKPGFNTDARVARLTRLQRRLNRGETGKALSRLQDLETRSLPISSPTLPLMEAARSSLT